MILVTTSRKADPLVRRIGRDIAFAAGGTYLTRGKSGLFSSPFSDELVLVLSRDGRGIRMQILDRMEEGPTLRFPSVREEVRPGSLRRGVFTGDPGLLACLGPYLPLQGDAELPAGLVFDGVQGRRVSLGV
jgi:U3 small nucleolar ribonucleoprotein protein IMP4